MSTARSFNKLRVDETMDNLVSGYLNTGLLYIAARLRIADRLAHGPRSARDLASDTGAHATSLEVFLQDNLGQGAYAGIWHAWQRAANVSWTSFNWLYDAPKRYTPTRAKR
jgi:hypothetical protein